MDSLTKAFVKGCQDQDLRLEESAQLYCMDCPGVEVWMAGGKYHVQTKIDGVTYHTYRDSWRELASAIGVLLDMRASF